MHSYLGKTTPAITTDTDETTGRDTQGLCLTPITGKVFVSSIGDDITGNLHTQHLLHNAQNGFLGRRSCPADFVRAQNTVILLMAEGENVDNCCLYFN